MQQPTIRQLRENQLLRDHAQELLDAALATYDHLHSCGYEPGQPVFDRLATAIHNATPARRQAPDHPHWTAAVRNSAER